SELKLLDGHILTAQTEGSRTTVGESVNRVIYESIEITDENGVNVNAYYDISCEDGTLEVTPRPITVITASNSWVYDGTAHSEESHSVK
ncbi:MAG: hypothetical protein ACI4MH_01280, partial [Candidatus Coproplasma sp.]